MDDAGLNIHIDSKSMLLLVSKKSLIYSSEIDLFLDNIFELTSLTLQC